ncbi:hypothetical protein BCR33DRAFT_780392 [Rhizoclosmatium globosum]|uniref:DUF4436 domain-containing protein n=1 Tax=Rhizoclosmatium globosum TaxID=329046 RepID=A0A1Y2CWK0_9FUNG|nr:hypothetical protein BCR33DRAFT_780392 [Rhizoclosmatium globosum]|eukprot:ORY51413.1 hypothetical protein BCR33DRAFT_780392 [Rhizoclosmatium globosum]
MPLNPKQKLVALSATLFVLLAIVVGGLTAIGVNSKKSSDGRVNYYVDSNSNLTLAAVTYDKTQTFAQIEATMFSIDIPKNEAKLMLKFELFGKLDAASDPKQTLHSTLYYQSPYNINLTVGTTILSFPANRPLIPQSVTLMIDGDINTYPFDSLNIGYVVYGSYGLPGKPSEPLAINLIQDGVPTGFQVSYNAILDQLDNTEILAVGSITRTATIRTIAIFFALLMWGLAISSAIFTVGVYVFEKEVLAPAIGFEIALLFSMPAVRNAMPLAPPVGCLIDQMVLVWVMMILALFFRQNQYASI